MVTCSHNRGSILLLLYALPESTTKFNKLLVIKLIMAVTPATCCANEMTFTYWPPPYYIMIIVNPSSQSLTTDLLPMCTYRNYQCCFDILHYNCYLDVEILQQINGPACGPECSTEGWNFLNINVSQISREWCVCSVKSEFNMEDSKASWKQCELISLTVMMRVRGRTAAVTRSWTWVANEWPGIVTMMTLNTWSYHSQTHLHSCWHSTNSQLIYVSCELTA